jgi:hypothetical protein
MDLNTIIKQIKEYEANTNDLKVKLDEGSNIIVKDIKKFIKQKYQQEVESHVKTNTENTKGLGLDKLRELKQELIELIEKSSLLVDKYVTDDIWTHKNYVINIHNEFNQSYAIKTNTTKNIDSAIRNAYGHLGQLLNKYGYIKYLNGSDWEKHYSSEIPRFRFSLCISDELQNSIDNYILLHEELHKVYVQLNRATKQKEEKEATDLWEQA